MASACTEPASSAASVALIMRWRSIRLFPSKEGDTIYTLKWVSPPGLWPAWPSCKCDSSVTSRLSGRKASRNLFMIASLVLMAAALRPYPCFVNDGIRRNRNVKSCSQGHCVVKVSHGVRFIKVLRFHSHQAEQAERECAGARQGRADDVRVRGRQ